MSLSDPGLAMESGLCANRGQQPGVLPTELLQNESRVRESNPFLEGESFAA